MRFFLLFVGLALTLRLVLALTLSGHLGIDGGAALLNAYDVLGDEPTGAGFPKPPLAPGWLLVPFLELFGIEVGYKIWSALASLLPAIPVYLLARRIQGGLTPFPALFAAGFLLLDWFNAEMFVTGSLPLIAFALLGMVWWAMGSLAVAFSWRVGGVLVACLALIPFVNQTTAGLAVITIPVYGLALLWYNRPVVRRDGNGVSFPHRHAPSGKGDTLPGGVMLRLALPLLVGGLLALTALPWYTKVLPGSPLLHFDGPWIYPAGPFDVMWLQAVVVITLGIWVARKAREPWLRALAIVQIVLGLLMPWLSYDETVINLFYRSSYLAPITFWVLLAWAVSQKWAPWFDRRPRIVAKAFLGVAVAVMLVGYVWSFENQASYSRMVGVEAAEALTIVKTLDPHAPVLSNSFSLSLWIAALNKVGSPFLFTAPPPKAYVEDEQAGRCIMGWLPGCDVGEAQKRLGVRYALIDERFPDINGRNPGNYLAPPDQWSVTASVPWLELVFSSGTVRLWRIVV